MIMLLRDLRNGRGCPSTVFSSTRALICRLFCQRFSECQNLTGNTGILIKALRDRNNILLNSDGNTLLNSFPSLPLVLKQNRAWRSFRVFVCHWFFDSIYSIYLILAYHVNRNKKDFFILSK